jgi:ribosomal protein S18 acetylase RimI-like enzyme
MDVIIRQWRREDLESVQRVTWETWIATYLSFIPEKDLRTYFDLHYNLEALSKLFHSEFVNGCVAVVEGTVAGYAKTKLNREENRFYISSLYVLPSYQGQGLGMKLLRAAEECAMSYHVDRVWLGVMAQNIGALAWYRKIGFDFVEEAPFTMGDTTVNHLIGFKLIRFKS